MRYLLCIRGWANKIAIDFIIIKGNKIYNCFARAINFRRACVCSRRVFHRFSAKIKGENRFFFLETPPGQVDVL